MDKHIIPPEIYQGKMFYQAAQSAIDYLILSPVDTGIFIFNEIKIELSWNSCIKDICRIYDLECKVRRLEAGYRD